MKTVPHIDLSAAHVLTPAEMNAIHFETGLHTDTGPKGSAIKIQSTPPNK
ncbi:MAG: hypothetical protein NC342_03305 [Pseudoflavonifractor sp.]|nr:hypothetical protein [Alloprevotella sp.]MCM1116542.1 hypothetical protein [Pseudoflavonifractor sp.]